MFLHSDDIYSHFCLSILYIWFTSFFICLVLFSNIFYNKLTGILPNISLFTESKNGWFTPYFVFYYKCRISLYNFYRLFETYNLRNKFSLLFCFKNSENYLLISLQFNTLSIVKPNLLQIQHFSIKLIILTYKINLSIQVTHYMAFVFESERNLNEIPKLTNPVGPGQYFKEDEVKIQSFSAPFNSTLIRKSLFDKQTGINIGPGQYDISRDIIEPNIKTVSNSHSIIVKINSTGTSQFKSAKQRFQKDQNDVPGPGSYRCNEQKIKRRSQSMISPSKSVINKVKSLTQSLKKYPTIPQKVRGLTDIKYQQEVPEAQKLGPAHYNPDKKPYLNSTGTVWGKDKTRRFSLDKANNVGPGKYRINLAPFQEKEVQQSSNFKSATVRTYFDSLFFKTNLNKTARQRDQGTFKTKDPAPGQYDVNISSFKIKQKPFSFQFFGSTVQRFADEPEQQSENKSAFYNIKSSIGKNSSFNKGTHGFNSESQRKTQFLKVKQREFVPGPGHYKEKIVVQRKLRGLKVEKFGSTTDRPFFKKEEVVQVGPGKYLSKEVSQQDKIMKDKFGQLKSTTSNFRSETGRQCFGSVKSQAPLGEYEVGITDIAWKIEKQKSYLQNLKKIEVEKAPFQSTHSRFPHYESKSPSKQKKPTMDDVNKQHEMKIKEQKERVRQAIIEFNRSQLKDKEVKGYFGKSQRFHGMKRGAPGVGHYKVDNSFEKKTFNVKYSNQAK